MVPAYFEAGRFTAGNVHWARVGADVLPASETEFARDATLGSAASDLREFVAETSRGAVQPGDVGGPRGPCRSARLGRGRGRHHLLFRGRA
jgi:Sugar-binding N-terminal domain